MKEIVAAASAEEGTASPLKKTKQDKPATMPASLSSEEVEDVKKALDLVKSVAAPGDEAMKRNEDIYPSSSTSLKPLIPDSFAGPYKGERRLLFGLGGFGFSSKAKKEVDEEKKKKGEKDAKNKKGDSDDGSFLAPLQGYDGKEVAVTKKTAKGVWKVATLSGLWQFSHLDEKIDRVRNAVWQGALLFPIFSL